MADLENLRTASVYINNQLLSRGLLRDGRAINFADHPASDEEAVDTMARIISVVNDLILRRDRDAEHRESLSTALRTVRAESLRQANDLQRVREQHVEAQRRADLGEAAEAHVRAQLAASEAATRKMREEATRLRSAVAQNRAACALDVRKRDRQIDALKKAVTEAGRARGERKSPAITSIVVGGSAGSAGSGGGSSSSAGLSSPAPSTPSATTAKTATTATASSTLHAETNAFLARLAGDLSRDNEALLAIVRHTQLQLAAMSGYDREENEDERAEEEHVPVDINANTPEQLAYQMEAVLEHLRMILTNPSFVPIEEVEQRESEIVRLRHGWVKMEGRWKEAVHLMDGWRRRMTTSGRSVNLEEIKMGLRLSPVRVKNVAETGGGAIPLEALAEEEEKEAGEEAEAEEVACKDDYDSDEESVLGRSIIEEESLHLVPAPVAADEAEKEEGVNDLDHDDDHADYDDDDNSDISSMFDDMPQDNDEPNVQIIEQSTVMPSLEGTPRPAGRSTPSPSPPESPLAREPRDLRKNAVTAKEMARETIKHAKQTKENREKMVAKAANTRPAVKAAGGIRLVAASTRSAQGPAALSQPQSQPRPQPSEARPARPGLQPSDTAANRGGDAAAAAAPASSGPSGLEMARGRKRPEEEGEKKVAREPAPKQKPQFQKQQQRPQISRPPPKTAPTTTAARTRAIATTTSKDHPVPRPLASPRRPAYVAGARPVAGVRPTSAASQASSTGDGASSTASGLSGPAAASGAPGGPPKTARTVAPIRPVARVTKKPVAAATAAETDAVDKTAAVRPKPSASEMPPPPPPHSSSSSLSSVPTTTSTTTTATTATAATDATAATTATTSARARSRSPVKRPGAGPTESAGSQSSETSSRLPQPVVSAGLGLAGLANQQPPQSPALSMAAITAKLVASEREADAARVRAKLRAARVRGKAAAATSAVAATAAKTKTIAGANTSTDRDKSAAPPLESVSGNVTAAAVVHGDPTKKMVPREAEEDDAVDFVQVGETDENLAQSVTSQTSNVSVDHPDAHTQISLKPRRKREQRDREHRRASRVASRRRSTLNPWELASLMTGAVAAPGGDAATEDRLVS